MDNRGNKRANKTQEKVPEENNSKEKTTMMREIEKQSQFTSRNPSLIQCGLRKQVK